MVDSISAAHLFIEVTRKCTLQCKHCMRAEKQDVTITKEIVDRIFDEVKECKSVSLGGGEPLLAIEMIEYIVNKIIENQWNLNFFQITTNGTIVDERVIHILNQLHKEKNDCLVLLRISGDEFHDKSVTESTFEKYSEMITDENVQIKITDEITMFEYAGKGKEYINHTKNPKYIKNLIAPLTEKYYIRFENNTLFCPIIISSNGNVAMFNCGAKEFIKIDELSLGNILYQSNK